MLTDETISDAEDFIFRGNLRTLEQVGEGLFKRVYRLPAHNAVIKVQKTEQIGRDRCNASFEFEWAFFVAAYRMGYGELFPDTVLVEYDGDMYFIQEVCRDMIHNSDDFPSDIYGLASLLGLVDLHDGNLGWTADMIPRPVVLDWGFDYPVIDSVADQVINAVCDRKMIPMAGN